MYITIYCSCLNEFDGFVNKEEQKNRKEISFSCPHCKAEHLVKFTNSNKQLNDKNKNTN